MRQPRARYATKAVIARLVDSARAAGLDASAIEVSPDGTVRLLPAAAVTPATEWDRWQDRL